VTSSGALAVHAYDQLETLLGQGTIGRELAAQAPPLDTLLVPVGGGGLIGGIAAWYAGSMRIIGVEPEAAPTLTAALKAGQPVDADGTGQNGNPLLLSDERARERSDDEPLGVRARLSVVGVSDPRTLRANSTIACWKPAQVATRGTPRSRA